MTRQVVFVTGATGMVGKWLCRAAVEKGYEVHGLVRSETGAAEIRASGAVPCYGDLNDVTSFADAIGAADIVVNVAAHVGDWGPAALYREINVNALEKMLTAVEHSGRINRWVQISSLGVYPSRDHFGTDEAAPIEMNGFDGYTQTKAEAEVLLRQRIQKGFPAVILRPGFIYGPGDRHVLPNLIRKLEDGQLKFIGKGEKVLNNTYAGNFVEGILLAMEKQAAVGEVFNMHDPRLVSRREFIGALCDHFNKPLPKSVPEWLARLAAKPIEGWARLRKAPSAPLLTGARLKFMANNLDFSMAKAQRLLGYSPQIDFTQGIQIALESYRQQAQR